MSNSKVTLIIDSGADVSLFKINKIKPDRLISTANKIKLTGITDSQIETLASTSTEIIFGNGLKIRHKFQIVSSKFPIQTDGRYFRTRFSLNQ